jgi:hypothetical protein
VSALVKGFASLGPAWRRVITAVGPLTAIIGTLLALGLIHPCGGDALAQGATRTGDAGTAHVDLAFTGAGRSFTGQGDFDYRAHRGAMHYDFSGTPGAEALDDVAVIFWGSHAYLGLGGGKGTNWVRFDVATAQKLLADTAAAQGAKPPPDVAALGDLQLNDPSQVLSYLTKAHGAKKIGTGTEFGVATTIYRAPVDTKGGHLVITASVGDDQYIHRLQIAGPDFTMDLRLSRFGNAVAVQPPPAAKVSELSDVLARAPLGG